MDKELSTTQERFKGNLEFLKKNEKDFGYGYGDLNLGTLVQAAATLTLADMVSEIRINLEKV